jgi:ElaB/YqjD/DUF883 family membrane-anchored ribosome-binding protein
MATQPNKYFDKVSDETSEKANTIKNQITEKAEKVKDGAVQAGQKAVEKIDAQREPSANALQSAATTLHEKAEDLPGGEKVVSIAHATADKIQSTADYVRNHDVSAMMKDVEGFVRQYPAQMLGGAAVLGFLLGRALRSRD